jgi:hypothetical protein
LLLVLLSALIPALTGCTGYRLGSALPPDVKTVNVPTFVNNTDEPLLETATTKATLRELQTDGSLRVRGPAEADTVLEVTLVEFKLEPLRYERDQLKKTREYRARVTADIVFRRARKDEILLKKRVQGDATFEPAGDLSLAKREALPLVAADLAHDIVESVVEYW